MQWQKTTRVEKLLSWSKLVSDYEIRQCNRKTNVPPNKEGEHLSSVLHLAIPNKVLLGVMSWKNGVIHVPEERRNTMAKFKVS